MFRCLALIFTIVSTFSMCAAQDEVKYADAQEMPASLVEDSYTIYQQVLPSNAIEWSDAPRTQWLLQDATTAVPLTANCKSGFMTDLHSSVTAPASRQSDWVEVLADFDARCYERYKLDAARFHMAVPVHLLDDAARNRYTNGVSGFMPPANNIMQAPPTPDDFKGAAGLHRFSSVYFNRAHTLAAVAFGMYCGGLCGQSTWVVLERKDGKWVRLPWAILSVISESHLPRSRWSSR
jgi:hypothetical protein